MSADAGAARAAVVALAVLAACGSDPAECRVDRYVALDESGQTPTDCGSFVLTDSNFTDAAMAASQACVLDAVAHAHSFTLVYDVYDKYQHLRAAWVGRAGGGKLALRVYGYVGDSLGGSGDPRPIVTVAGCGSVAATPSCTPTIGRPCLTCQMQSAGEALCRF